MKKDYLENTIKVGDKIKFSQSLINDWLKNGLIKLGEVGWWNDIHIVTEVGFEDERGRPIKNLDEYRGIIGDEYVILNNDYNTYSNITNDMIIIK